MIRESICQHRNWQDFIGAMTLADHQIDLYACYSVHQIAFFQRYTCEHFRARNFFSLSRPAQIPVQSSLSSFFFTRALAFVSLASICALLAQISSKPPYPLAHGIRRHQSSTELQRSTDPAFAVSHLSTACLTLSSPLNYCNPPAFSPSLPISIIFTHPSGRKTSCSEN